MGSWRAHDTHAILQARQSGTPATSYGIHNTITLLYCHLARSGTEDLSAVVVVVGKKEEVDASSQRSVKVEMQTHRPSVATASNPIATPGLAVVSRMPPPSLVAMLAVVFCRGVAELYDSG